MVEDDVLQEVRAAREAYAQSHGYDVRAMVADLRARDSAGDWPVVRRSPRRPMPPRQPAASTPQALQPVGTATSVSPGSESPEESPATER